MKDNKDPKDQSERPAPPKPSAPDPEPQDGGIDPLGVPEDPGKKPPPGPSGNP